MATFSVRIPDDLAARFDGVAAAAGGRSALVRRLVQEAAQAAAGCEVLGVGGRRDGARIMVRLTPAEAGVVDIEAARMAVSRAGWVAALVRRRVSGRPQFSRGDGLALSAVQGELRRIGVNINQIARALNTAVMEGRVLDLELGSLEDLRRELRAHVLGLREAFEGNLAYWEAEG